MSNIAHQSSAPHPDGQPVGAHLEAASAPRPADQHLPLASAPPFMASQGAGDGQSSIGNLPYPLPLAPAGAANLPSSAPPLALSFPPPAARQPLAAGSFAPAALAAYPYGDAAAYPMQLPLAAAPPSASSSALGQGALSYPLPLPAQGAQLSAMQSAQPAAAASNLSAAPPAGPVEVPKVDANGDHGMDDLPQLPTPPPPRLDASGAAYMPFAPVASGSGSTAAGPDAADGQQPAPGAVDAHGHPVALPAGPPPRPPPPPLKNKVGAPTITALTGHVPIPSHLPKPRGRKIPKVRSAAATSAVKGEDGAAAGDESAGTAAPAVKARPLTAAQKKKKRKETEEELQRKASRGGWGAAKGKQGTRPETFLRKMWKLLNHDPEDVTPYMRWDKTGRLIMIPDEKALVENVCKVHFSQQNITSFNKQMNNWDFKRHSRSQRDLEIIGRTEPGVNRQTRIWYHTQLHARSTWSDVQNVGRHEDGMAKKRKAQEDAEVNGPRKRGRKPKRKVDDDAADDDDDDAPEAETSEAAATRISASLRSKARDPTKRPSYKLYDSDDESLSGSSGDELGSDDYKEDGGRGKRRVSDSDELDDLTDSDEEGEAGGPSAGAGETAAQAPDGAAGENDQLEVGAEAAGGAGDAEMVDAQRTATKGKARASSAAAAAKGKGKARAASPARAGDETPTAAVAQEKASASSVALPGHDSVVEVVGAFEGETGRGAAAASAEEAAAQGAAVAAVRDEKEAAKQERKNGAAAAPEPASVAPAAGSSAAEDPSPAIEPRSTRTTRGAPSPFTRGKDAAAAAHPTAGRPSRAAAARAAAALNPGADGGSSRGDRAARREVREPKQSASGAEQDESVEDGALARSQNGRAPAPAGSTKPPATAKKGKSRSREAVQQEAAHEEDKEVGPSQGHDMLRGGAAFGAGAASNGSSHEEDAAAAQALALQPSAANGSAMQAHVYSLPRPPHLGTAASALAAASAMVDGSTSASVKARSPSAASHDSHGSNQFIYPDASNPYGSSPYPAYPHQAQTPVTVHHHPTRPLPGPYHSEPGLARTAFYYHGASPIPRPFIHPGHGLTDEVLDSADAAGVYGDEFASGVVMQDAALEGRF